MTDKRTENEIIAQAYSDEARATWKAPVQVGRGGTMYIPWDIHLEAYEAYCKKYGKQTALIDLKGRGCRGGFGTEELDGFVPGWRDRVTAYGAMTARIAELEKQLEATKAPMGNSFILLYQPPVGLWYVHSHKVYCSTEDAEDTAKRFLHPDTPIKNHQPWGVTAMTNIVHIMLDLETWGTEPGSDIRSIGACVFDPLTGYMQGCNPDGSGGIFYVACDNPLTVHPDLGFMNSLEEWRRYDLDRDPRTVQWWSEQSDEAQAAFANPVDMREALEAFSMWLMNIGYPHERDQQVPTDSYINPPINVRIWSHGPSFDPPILAAVYKAVGLPVPWNYRAPRDTRTAFDMAGISDDGDGSYRTFMSAYNTETHHHALDDAIAQARAVCGAYGRTQERDKLLQNVLDCQLVGPPYRGWIISKLSQLADDIREALGQERIIKPVTEQQRRQLQDIMDETRQLRD